MLNFVKEETWNWKWDLVATLRNLTFENPAVTWQHAITIIVKWLAGSRHIDSELKTVRKTKWIITWCLSKHAWAVLVEAIGMAIVNGRRGEIIKVKF
jgi:hypothetical protein